MRDPSLDLGLASEVPLGTAEPADANAEGPSGGLLGRAEGWRQKGTPASSQSWRRGGGRERRRIRSGALSHVLSSLNLFSQLALSKCRTGCDWRWRGPPRVASGRQAGRLRRRPMLTEALPRDQDREVGAVTPMTPAGAGGAGAGRGAGRVGALVAWGKGRQTHRPGVDVRSGPDVLCGLGEENRSMSVTLVSRSANCRHSVHLRVGAGCRLLGSARHESDPSRCSMLGLSLRFGGSSELPSTKMVTPLTVSEMKVPPLPRHEIAARAPGAGGGDREQSRSPAGNPCAPGSLSGQPAS